MVDLALSYSQQDMVMVLSMFGVLWVMPRGVMELLSY